MIFRYKLLISIPLFFLCACAQLNVRVYVLDKRKLQNTTDWIADDVIARSHVAIQLLGGDPPADPSLKKQALAAFDSMEPSLVKLQIAFNRAAGPGHENDQSAILYYKNEIFAAYATAAGKYALAIQTTKAAEKIHKEDQRRGEFLAAKADFDAADLILLQAVQQIHEELSSSTVALLEKVEAPSRTAAPGDPSHHSSITFNLVPPTTTSDAVPAAQIEPAHAAPSQPATSEAAPIPQTQPAPLPRAVVAQIPSAESLQSWVDEASANVSGEVKNSLVGNASILSDRHAAAVVNAPWNYWTGEPNDCYAFGGFGNTDIAVRQMSLGTFTLKGVRVDSTKVIQATFASIKTGIQIAAAAYGVPIPSNSSGSSASTPPANTGTAPTSDATTASNLKQHRLAALTILQSIVDQQDKFEDKSGKPSAAANKDSDAQAAIIQIQNVFKAYQSQLNLGNSSH